MKLLIELWNNNKDSCGNCQLLDSHNGHCRLFMRYLKNNLAEDLRCEECLEAEEAAKEMESK